MLMTMKMATEYSQPGERSRVMCSARHTPERE